MSSRGARKSDPRGPQAGAPEGAKIGSRGPRSTDFSGQPPKDFLVQKTSPFFWPIVRPSYLDPLIGPKNLVHFPSPEILGSLARGGQRPKDLLVQKMALAGSIFRPSPRPGLGPFWSSCLPPPGVCAGGWARVHLSGINAPFVVLCGCGFSTLACAHFCGAAARLVTVGGADSSDHRLLVARSSTFSSKQPHTQINSRHMLRLYKKQNSTEVKKTTRNQIWHHQFKETVAASALLFFKKRPSTLQ